MREAFLDFNHIGHGCRFRIRLFTSEREGLGVGDIVLVVRDSVEPRQAKSHCAWPRMAATLSWNS